MLKKAFLSGVLLFFVFLASGCGTVYQGAKGVKDGVREDWTNFAKGLDNADSWFKRNLW